VERDMETANVPIAFVLLQRLSLLKQETHNTPQITDSCSLAGLILVDSQPGATTWLRKVEEFILAPEQIRAMAGGGPVEREQLRLMHVQTLAKRTIRVHEDDPIAITSDRLNRKPVIPVVADMVPYNVPNEPRALPAFSIYWPTVTPAFPEERRQPGANWKGSVSVACGAGVFPLSYSVLLKEYVANDPVVQMTIDQQQPSAKAGKITLQLKPAGSWSACISHADSVCRWAKGQYSASVRATLKNSDDDIDVEVLRWRNEFSVERTVLPFDEKKIYPAIWKPEMNPETAFAR